MRTAERTGRPFKFVGGWPCLDFVNTMNWGSRDPIYERFFGLSDFIWWNRAAGYFDEEETRRLLDEADHRPELAETLFKQGLALRETIHRLFAAVAHHHSPDPADLAAINTALAETLARSRLTPIENGFRWQWAGEKNDLTRIYWPVLWSAAELLISGRLERVGQCGGTSCGWLFFDTTRNHSRRWCEMEHCGNRAKAKRHYRRKVRSEE